MSALPDNALMLWEQRANAKRGLIYTLALSVAIVVALLVAAVVWGSIAFDEGVQVGKRIAADTPKVAPADCGNLARICAEQMSNRWKRK